MGWRTCGFCGVLVACLASAGHSATLLTGGDAADGWQLDANKVVFAVDCCGGNYVMQGVQFVGYDPRLQVVWNQDGWFTCDFVGAVAFPGEHTADDTTLETMTATLGYATVPLDFYVSGLVPGVEYKLDFVFSTAQFGPRCQQLYVFGNLVDTVDLNYLPESVYLVSTTAVADANGYITGTIVPFDNTPNGGFGADGLVWSIFAISSSCDLSSTWANTGGGNWNTPSNWSSCPPNSPDSEAVFGPAITSDAAVTVDANVTLRQMTFNNSAHSYSIAGDGIHTLTLAQVATLDTLAGSHQISIPVGGTAGITKTGNGTILLSGMNTYVGPTTVAGGTLALTGSTTNNIPGPGTITVNAGATLNTTGLAGGGIVLSGGQNLAGDGTIVGAVTAGPGNTVSPGGAAGPLTITAGLTLCDGAVISVDPTTATGFLRVTGGTMTGAGTGTITVHVANPASLRTGTTYTLIDWQGAVATGVEAGDFFLDPAGGVTGTLAVIGSQLTLTIIHGSSPLLGEWLFDETSGTVAHNTVNNAFDGVFGDGAGGTPMLTWQPGAGKSGGALHLDNGSARVEIPAGLNLGTQFTISAWFKLDGDFDLSTPGWARLITSSWDNGFFIGEAGNSGQLMFIVNGSWDLVASPIVLGEWQHVVASYDGTTARLYLNGTEVGSAPMTPPSAPAQAIYFGSDNGTEPCFKGLIDEFRIYGTAPTPTELKILNGTRFDYTSDGNVDATDLAVFQGCFTGPSILGTPAGCSQADFLASDVDADGDVDQDDFGVFQAAFTGTVVP